MALGFWDLHTNSEIALVAGVTSRTVANWRGGKTKITLDHARRLAAAYDMPLSAIYGGEDKSDTVRRLEEENAMLRAKFAAIQALLRDEG